jgi:hypothetical protein
VEPSSSREVLGGCRLGAGPGAQVPTPQEGIGRRRSSCRASEGSRRAPGRLPKTWGTRPPKPDHTELPPPTPGSPRGSQHGSGVTLERGRISGEVMVLGGVGEGMATRQVTVRRRLRDTSDARSGPVPSRSPTPPCGGREGPVCRRRYRGFQTRRRKEVARTWWAGNRPVAGESRLRASDGRRPVRQVSGRDRAHAHERRSRTRNSRRRRPGLRRTTRFLHLYAGPQEPSRAVPAAVLTALL